MSLKRAAGRRGQAADPEDPKRRRTAPAAGPGARRAAPERPEGPPPETERPEAASAGAPEPETPHEPESALDALRARRARSRQASATPASRAPAAPAADPPGAGRGPPPPAAAAAAGSGREADRLLALWLKQLQPSGSQAGPDPHALQQQQQQPSGSQAGPGPDPHALRLAQHLHRRYLAVQPRQHTKKGRYLPAPAAAADLAACLWLALKLSANQTAVPRAGAVGAVAGVARERVVAREAAVAGALQWKLLENDPSVRAAPEPAAPPGTP